MRITHINLANEFRGGERQTLALCRALGQGQPADEFTQRLVCRRDSPLQARAARIEALHTVGVANSPLSALRASARSDLVHVHDGRSVQVGALRSLLSATPFLFTRRLARAPSDASLTRWAYGRASAAVGVSQAVAGALRTWPMPGAVEVIFDCLAPIPVDAAQAQRLREASGAELIVGHVGALDDATKGQLAVLGAARALALTHPHVQFWLLGSGPDEAMLKRQAESLPNVRFHGWVQNIGDYYRAMDLFVFPSRFEALGSAVLEAMSQGLATVAYATGGVPELVCNEHNGLLVPAGDEPQLIHALARMLDEPPLRAHCAQGARETSARFTPEVMARQYAALYRSIRARAS